MMSRHVSSALRPPLRENLLLSLAYIDPGSGSLILQMLLAGIAGLFVFVKYQGRRIVGIFHRVRRLGESKEG